MVICSHCILCCCGHCWSWPGQCEHQPHCSSPKPSQQAGQHCRCVPAGKPPGCNGHSHCLSYGSSVLLPGSFWLPVFLTVVTLQFIPLLKTELQIQIIPFKHPTPLVFRTNHHRLSRVQNVIFKPELIIHCKYDGPEYSPSQNDTISLNGRSLMPARRDTGKSPFKLVLVLQFCS